MKGHISPQAVKDMGEFLDSYVEHHSIPFRRGTPRNFAAWLVRVYTLFTLPPVLDYAAADALNVKCLYGLWNVVTDDRIDCEHEGKEDLIDTFNVIQNSFLGKKMQPKSIPGQIMKDFLEGFRTLPTGPNSEIIKEFLFLDLLQVINAFDYERIALARSGVVTLSEFMEFSTSPVDVRCILDIDLALIQKKITLLTIGKLREVYRILGMAFRLFNDVATFKREFSSEKSLNSVVLRGIEKGIFPQDTLHFLDREKKRICREDTPLHEDIKTQINLYKQLAASKISQIAEINLESIARNFDSLVGSVSSEDNIRN